MHKKKRPIIYLFSDDCGLRSPVIQKTELPKTGVCTQYTSVVARAMYIQQFYLSPNISFWESVVSILDISQKKKRSWVKKDTS